MMAVLNKMLKFSVKKPPKPAKPGTQAKPPSKGGWPPPFKIKAK